METITIFTAGEAKGNPGPAAIAVRILDTSGQLLKEVAESIGNATSNFAEYQAVLRGLQVAEEYFGDKTKELQFELKLDGELVKKQLNGEVQIKEPGFVPYFIEIHNLRVASFVNLKFKQISPEKNQITKKLATELLDRK